MNEALMENVYKAIRGDRVAFRTLVERYRGVAYALAYRETHSFPRAQRVAMRAWSKLAERLPNLAEPERFLELLAESVRAVAPNTPDQPDPESKDTEHSILKTEKVQARRALRKALATCPRPEANAFFLRFIEGLSTEEISALYGVEPHVAVEAQAAVCLDLAYRAGVAGPADPVPTLEDLPTERREALLLCVRQSESSLDDESAHRLSDLIQNTTEIRREVEATRTVLALSPATFAAHRLPMEFVREAMHGIPLIEPRAPVAPPVQRPIRPETEPVEAVPGFLFIAGFMAGIILPIVAVTILEPYFADWELAPVLLAVVATILPMGMLSLLMARPPLNPPAWFPKGYYLAYALFAGCLLTFFIYQLAGTDADQLALWCCVAPFWAVSSLGLVGLRWHLDLQRLEKQWETRLHRLETAVQIGPEFKTPVLQPAVTAQLATSGSPERNLQ